MKVALDASAYPSAGRFAPDIPAAEELLMPAPFHAPLFHPLITRPLTVASGDVPVYCNARPLVVRSSLPVPRMERADVVSNLFPPAVTDALPPVVIVRLGSFCVAPAPNHPLVATNTPLLVVMQLFDRNVPALTLV